MSRQIRQPLWLAKAILWTYKTPLRFILIFGGAFYVWTAISSFHELSRKPLWFSIVAELLFLGASLLFGSFMWLFARVVMHIQKNQRKPN